MYIVYILKSKDVNRYYTGYTSSLAKRLKSHNAGKVRSTKAYRPWEVSYAENFINKTLARKRELEIKSYKGGKTFKKLLGKH